MTRGRWLLAALLAAAAIAIVALDPGQYLSLETLKARQSALEDWVGAHPLEASLGGFAVYVAVTALSIPGAAVMTLAAGAVFGLLWGTVIVSFASSVGATLAFLIARYLLHDAVQARFGHRLRAVNRGVERDGPIYLLTLRLIPVIPFFVINVLMALTPIATRHFYLYSQIGMLPATLVFVNAGTRLAQIERPGDILSAPVLVSLGLLAALPFVTRWAGGALRWRRFLERFPRPPMVDRNLIVIGAGSAGLVTAVVGAAVRAKVTLIEKDAMGGDCLNTGCVPSKALIRVARQLHDAREAHRLGLAPAEHAFEFRDVMQRVRDVIDTIAPHDSAERFESLGVEVIRGEARLVSPHTVRVNGRDLSARAIVLATGARPFVPPIDGIEDVDYLTSDTVWALESLPPRLLVLGAGPIGCELAQAFARLGSRVTVVDMAARLLPREDEDCSALLAEVFEAEGIEVRLGLRAAAFRRDEDGWLLRCLPADAADDDAAVDVGFDRVLVAVGRRATVDGLGLEALGVALDEDGTLEVDSFLRTVLPTVYACGDVAGPYQFTHVASHQAWHAAVNALFGSPLKRFAVDYRVIPWCTFTDPEVARVGLSEADARDEGVAFELTRYELAELDRAIAEGARTGFVKVLTAPGSDRVLGATIVGERAGELIATFVLAMTHGLGLKKILGTIHVYPTLSEAAKLAAGSWRREHASARLLRWVERFHRWRREGRPGRRRTDGTTD